MDSSMLLVDALAQFGLEAEMAGGVDGGVDFVLLAAGVRIPVQVKRRSLVTAGGARQMIDGQRDESLLMVVADRVTSDGRQMLIKHGVGYFDLRGHLALRRDHLIIDADVEPLAERPRRSGALAGKVGLEVATHLLLNPADRPAVRRLARDLGRSASTVSQVLAALRKDGLISDDGGVTSTDLFWAVADRWGGSRTLLARAPGPGDSSLMAALAVGIDDPPGPGWALTDSAAAAAYGAPVAVRSDQALDFLVPHQTLVRRAVTLLDAATSASQAKATIRVAPVPAAVEGRIDTDGNPFEWPLAQPLFVALELAQDPGRGQEILRDWNPDQRWPRVW